MNQFLSLLLAIFRALPAMQKAWDELVSLYIKAQFERIKKENREAIRKAVNEQDQRDIEQKLGSSRAGEPSGISGTRIVDKLPNVGMPSGPQK